ncbi:Aste57867_12167 [Aphanomyces stellatus]|uniref:Aste57867_12167 protein n=1 Tax=Aphanomyces stellatus TaxID=120398 RepID=A0A485KUT8_9STRA|nr:hypothetical protein As57867_012122 [Aphanomyces stellatus]VFT89021.1 Aste57867_12167 [Aphanomyces stellatus]
MYLANKVCSYAHPKRVAQMLWYVCESIDANFNVTLSKANLIGAPDVVMWHRSNLHRWILVLVVKCKSPWSFAVPDDVHLHELFNTHPASTKTGSPLRLPYHPSNDPRYALERKVVHAICQLYGYMSWNKKRFGILSTFTSTYLFKREDGGNLFISQCLVIDRADPMPVLEAIARLLLADNASEDLKPAASSPVKPPAKWTHTPPFTSTRASAHDDREILPIESLPDYAAIAGGNSGTVIATQVDGEPVAIKTVDTFKHPQLLDELFTECAAYAALETLQGICIPTLVRPAPVMLSEGSIDGLVVSLVPGSTLEEMDVDGIAAIPRACRERAVHDLREIHKLAVLHGDVAERNLILHDVKAMVRASSSSILGKPRRPAVPTMFALMAEYIYCVRYSSSCETMAPSKANCGHFGSTEDMQCSWTFVEN